MDRIYPRVPAPQRRRPRWTHVRYGFFQVLAQRRFLYGRIWDVDDQLRYEVLPSLLGSGILCRDWGRISLYPERCCCCNLLQQTTLLRHWLSCKWQQCR